MRLIIILAVLCGLSSGPGSAQAQNPFDELWNLRLLALKSSFKAYEQSSYDRTGGNRDWGNYVSVDRSRKVLADITGPGEISRIWSANPSGMLKIFLNGESTPYIGGDFAGVFQNQVSPFEPPFATKSSGGWISYWPIRFQESARVEVDGGADFYYQVTYRTFNQNETQAFFAPVSSSDVSYRNATSAWKSPGSPLPIPAHDALVTGGSSESLKKILRIAHGATKTIALAGGGYISELRFMLPSSQTTSLRKTRLVMHWDGSNAAGVDVPILDVFGSSFGLKDYRSLLTGRSKDGWWYLRLPMPFRKAARISIVNQSNASLTIPTQVRWVKGKVSTNALYYRASFHTGTTVKDKPYTILNATGDGQFIGDTISMQGVNGLGFLEGDEMISIDGRPSTDYNGTGTEDYFNSGWYFGGGNVAQPVHGCLVKDAEMSRISVYRYHLTDRIPFKSSFKFDLEHGASNSAPGANYSSVAHWYSSKPADASTPVVNARSLAIPRKAYVPPPHSLPLADLLRTERSGGTIEKATWNSISDTFGGGSLVIFRPANIGNAMSLRLSVPYADEGPISLIVCKGPGMGKMRVSIDDIVIGDVDLWSPEANHPARVDLKALPLQKGVHSLRIKSVGRNSASRGLAIAVGYLQVGSGSAFIHKWAVLGPIRAGANALNSEQVANEGSPAWGVQYEGGFGAVSWTIKDAPSGILSLPPENDSVNYCAAVIESEGSFDTEMLLGSDDSVKVWLNDEVVHSNETSRATIADDDIVRVHLKPGRNLLVAKVINGTLDSGLVVRFRDLNKKLKFSTPDLANQ